MAHERKCLCCGTTYEYCAHGCKDSNPNETWRFIFHDEKCKDVYDVWQAVRGKEMTKDEAAKVLKALNVSEIIAADTVVSKDIKDILGIVDEVKEEVIEEKQEPMAKDRPKVEERHFNKNNRDFKKK